MYIKKTFTLCIILIATNSFTLKANANIPYEQCEKLKKSYTDRVLGHLKNQSQQTECKTCEQIKSDPEFKELSNANKFIGSYNNRIPTECFLASSTMATYKKGEYNKKNYYFCKRPTSEEHLLSMTGNEDDYPTRPCLTKDYTNMTSESFHYMADCMGFDSLEDKQELFALFNHESGFLLNNRSKTGARCYGQLTGTTVRHIEEQMYNRYKGVKIYKKALEKCPNLNNKIIVPKEILNSEKKGEEAFNKIKEDNPITCRTTQDPYTCFFYSMFNVKMNKKALDAALKNTPKNNNPQIKDSFTAHLPITLNEILHVKGRYVEGKNKGKEIDWILQDNESVSQFRKNTQIESYSIKKKKIFDKKSLEKIKWIVLHTSYNGGGSIISNHFKPFLQKQKQRIATPCANTLFLSKTCLERTAIKKGLSLTHRTFYSNFKKYLSSHYNNKSQQRKKEVAHFYQKIKKDMDVIRSWDFKKALSSRLTKLNKKDKSITGDEMRDFLHGISQKCTF